MPYFITDKSADCSGWATIKEDGEVIGCHTTKQGAIDQMVAVSIAEDMAPGGERIDTGPQAVIVDIDGVLIRDGQRVEKTYDFLEAMDDTEIIIVTGRPDSSRAQTITELELLDIDYDQLFMNPGSTNESPAFKKMTAEKLLETYNVIIAIDDNEINRNNYKSLGITALSTSDIPDTPMQEDDPSDDSLRQVNLQAPAYMRAAARRGLELNAQGFGGDGLVDRTIREARAMADGQISADKWRRIAPWIARHMIDLDAPSNRNPDDPGYPGAGLVAHLLWGSGPSKASATRAMNYAQSIIDQLDKEEQNSRWSSIAIQLDKDKEDKSMTPKVERRIKTDVDFEIRLEPDTKDGMRFTGYAAVFDSNSEPLPFIERIVPGAFKRSLKARNEIKMFVNHNMDMVLASTRAKTLRLTEDSKGLLAEAELPDTTYGRDLSVLMKRGDVHAMSFGFSVPKKGDRWSEDGTTRELLDIRLHEVSIVTGFPAYEATTASVRTLEIVASRTNTDPDKLADALLKLESGEALNAENAELITEVVTKLRDDKPLLGSFNNLDIKRKQLDLIYKAI
jgi:uncharacterized protein